MSASGKKYYIAVDLEGVSCVAGTYGQGLAAGTSDYAFACEQGSKEAAAAAKALFDNGAAEVWVWDNHGTGVNLNYRIFDPRCQFVIGAGSRKRFPGIDSSFAGVLFIGYHAYDTPDAVLAHVYSSATYQHQKINGSFIGELDIDAAIAGKAGVPPLFVSSDNICVAQATQSFPGIATVTTKKALAWNSCISKHPEAVCNEIYGAVTNLLKKDSQPAPYTIPEPFNYEIRFKRIEYAQGCTSRNPDGTLFDRIDAYTRSGKMATLEQIFE